MAVSDNKAWGGRWETGCSVWRAWTEVVQGSGLSLASMGVGRAAGAEGCRLAGVAWSQGLVQAGPRTGHGGGDQ